MHRLAWVWELVRRWCRRRWYTAPQSVTGATILITHIHVRLTAIMALNGSPVASSLESGLGAGGAGDVHGAGAADIGTAAMAIAADGADLVQATDSTVVMWVVAEWVAIRALTQAEASMAVVVDSMGAGGATAVDTGNRPRN